MSSGHLPIGVGADVPGTDRTDVGVSPSRLVLCVDPSNALRAADPRRCGGKGSALAELIAAGLPVPAIAIVPTTAFDRVVGDGELRTFTDSIAAGETAPPDEEVDAAFAGSVDASLRAELGRVATVLGWPVAVRSSATTEDLGSASFAGQYRSVLGVDDLDGLAGAVESVWASLWHRAPVAYRRVIGLDHADVSMAVVIQRMVEAVRAGVVFTLDPGGGTDMVRIEHVAGLGEALVSGAITPEVVLRDRSTIPTPPTGADTDDGFDSLDPVARASGLALSAERWFGCPQDVEWADDGRTTWLVQSRPITTLASDVGGVSVEPSVHPERRYTTAGIAEMLPGVLPELRWSTAGFMVDTALHESVAALGATSPGAVGDRFVVRVRGRSALDLDQVARVADDLPGGSPEQLEAELLGGEPVAPTVNDPLAEATDTSRVARWTERVAAIRHDLRLVRATRTCRRESTIVVGAIDRVVDRESRASALDDRELLSLRARVVDLGLRATVAEVSTAMAAVGAHRRLADQLDRHLGTERAADWVGRVLAATDPRAALGPACEAASRVATSGVDATSLESWAEACRAFERAGRPALVADIESLADRMGSRDVVGAPTWRSDLDGFWVLVRFAAGADASRPDDLATVIAGIEADLVRQPRWRLVRWLTGQVVDVRCRVMRRLVLDTVDLLERREQTKAALFSLGGLLSRIDGEIGRRLAERRRLLEADDVAHLHASELAGVLLGDRVVPPVAVLRRRRRAERWASRPELPLRFSGGDVEHGPSASAVPSAGVRDGWAASPGRHTGTVRVLDVPTAEAVELGDVVVALRTDASWLPVLLRAGAIVVEQGGPLSHASIVARELGVPAVVNVPGIVEQLRGHARVVTVDGDAGLVIVGDTANPGSVGGGGP